MSKSQHTAASESMTINNDKLVPETHIQNIIFFSYYPFIAATVGIQKVTKRLRTER